MFGLFKKKPRLAEGKIHKEPTATEIDLALEKASRLEIVSRVLIEPLSVSPLDQCDNVDIRLENNVLKVYID